MYINKMDRNGDDIMKDNSVNNENIEKMQGQTSLINVNEEEAKEKGKKGGKKSTNSAEKVVFSARFSATQQEELKEILKSFEGENDKFADMVIKAHQTTVKVAQTELFTEKKEKLQSALEAILDVFSSSVDTHKEIVSKIATSKNMQEKAIQSLTEELVAARATIADLQAQLRAEAEKTDKLAQLQNQVEVLTKQLETQNTLENMMKMMQEKINK